MGCSQVGTSRALNLFSLAVIALVLLLILSVLADALVPRAYLNKPYVAEYCVGQRIIMSSAPMVWLQGVWLTSPPMPTTRVTESGIDSNAPSTVCGLIPWVSETTGFWYKAIR